MTRSSLISTTFVLLLATVGNVQSLELPSLISSSSLKRWSAASAPHSARRVDEPPRDYLSNARHRKRQRLNASSEASIAVDDEFPVLELPVREERRSHRSRRATDDDIPSEWVIQKIYQGSSFFDDWTFATYPDPTHGQVTYVSREWANKTNMAYVDSNGRAIMSVDKWSTLTQGQARNSVRIESIQSYNEGLFILDVEAAPWGCGVWPAYWFVGPGWPAGGEMDVIEGVHDNVHNQITYHTNPGCTLNILNDTTPSYQDYKGWVQGIQCNAYIANNAGCAVVDPSQASYGTQFNVLQGGVFAMMWTNDAVRVWFFHRAAIPQDIVSGQPEPAGWGTPTSYIGGGNCPMSTYFKSQTIVFDITFCGDWAGTSYVDSGCPGTCSERIQDPNNFANATWAVNYLHVYNSPQLKGYSSGASRTLTSLPMTTAAGVMSSSVIALFIVLSVPLL